MTAIERKLLEELNPETQEVIRFLIRDQAFSLEFLVTVIQEYYQNNTHEKI